MEKNMRITSINTNKMNTNSISTNTNYAAKYHSQPTSDTVNFKGSAVVKELPAEFMAFLERHNDIFKGLTFNRDGKHFVSEYLPYNDAFGISASINSLYDTGMDKILKQAQATASGVKRFLEEALTHRTITFPFDIAHDATNPSKIVIAPPMRKVILEDPFWINDANGRFPLTPLNPINSKLDQYILKTGLGGNEIVLVDGQRYFVEPVKEYVANVPVLNGIRYQKLGTVHKG